MANLKYKYTASKSRDSDRGGWIVSFRHPLVKDAQGKQGLKVRRGLGTSDEAKANELVAQLNELLSNEYFHSPVKRSDAARRFAPVVVAAFYDKVEAAWVDYKGIRDTYLPLPGKEQGYSKVLLVGTTGAGKTSLLCHLMGTKPEGAFPTVGNGRTTTADIEVVTGVPNRYNAVVTFYSEVHVRQEVQACVEGACLAVWDDRSDHPLTNKDVADKLLQSSDQTFRLKYILGNWTDQEESVVVGYVSRVRSLVAEAQQKLEQRHDSQSLNPEDSSFLEMLETISAFATLVDDILEQIRQRFSGQPVLVRTSPIATRRWMPFYWWIVLNNRCRLPPYLCCDR